MMIEIKKIIFRSQIQIQLQSQIQEFIIKISFDDAYHADLQTENWYIYIYIYILH